MSGISRSEQWYLLQLRVLGARWRLGSSALDPYLLLRYSLASCSPPSDSSVPPLSWHQRRFV